MAIVNHFKNDHKLGLSLHFQADPDTVPLARQVSCFIPTIAFPWRQKTVIDRD